MLAGVSFSSLIPQRTGRSKPPVESRVAPTPPTGPVLVRRTRLLPFGRRAENGESGRALGGPGPARRRDSAVGGHRADDDEEEHSDDDNALPLMQAASIQGRSAVAGGRRARRFLHPARWGDRRRSRRRRARAPVPAFGSAGSGSSPTVGDTGRPHPGDLQASVVGWHCRRHVHTARVRGAFSGAGSSTACAP